MDDAGAVEYLEDVKIDVHPASYFRWKQAVDRVLAAILLVPGLPMILGLVTLVRLTSRGPGIYCQPRVTRHGQLFMMYKVRTMVHDAEVQSGPVWAGVNDPRMTRLGRQLRRFHLDELPQLWNVLKGEMSLVGPRPERPEIIRSLVHDIPGYLNRLAVPAGITGLAQVNLPPDTDLDSVNRKLGVDMKYIESACVDLDLRILIYTALRFFAIPSTRLSSMLGLRTDETLDEFTTSGLPSGRELPQEIQPVNPRPTDEPSLAQEP